MYLISECYLILPRYWAGCDTDGLPLPKFLNPRFEAYFMGYSSTLSGESGTTVSCCLLLSIDISLAKTFFYTLCVFPLVPLDCASNRLVSMYICCYMAVPHLFWTHTEGEPKQRALPVTLALLSSASAVSASVGRGC